MRIFIDYYLQVFMNLY